jgi:hypothetical protein
LLGSYAVSSIALPKSLNEEDFEDIKFFLCQNSTNDSALLTLIKNTQPFHCSDIINEIKFCECITKTPLDMTARTLEFKSKLERDFRKQVEDSVILEEGHRFNTSLEVYLTFQSNNVLTKQEGCFDLERYYLPKREQDLIQSSIVNKYKNKISNNPIEDSPDVLQIVKIIKAMSLKSKQLGVSINSLPENIRIETLYNQNYEPGAIMKIESDLNSNFSKVGVKFYLRTLESVIQEIGEQGQSVESTTPKLLKKIIHKKMNEELKWSCNQGLSIQNRNYENKKAKNRKEAINDEYVRLQSHKNSNELIKLFDRVSLKNKVANKKTRNKYNERSFLIDKMFCEMRSKEQIENINLAIGLEGSSAKHKRDIQSLIENQHLHEEQKDLLNELLTDLKDIQYDIDDFRNDKYTDNDIIKLTTKQLEIESRIAVALKDLNVTDMNIKDDWKNVKQYAEKVKRTTINFNQEAYVTGIKKLTVPSSKKKHYISKSDQDNNNDIVNRENDIAAREEKLNSSPYIKLLNKESQDLLRKDLEKSKNNLDIDKAVLRGDFKGHNERMRKKQLSIQALSSRITPDIRAQVIEKMKIEYKDDPQIIKEIAHISKFQEELKMATSINEKNIQSIKAVPIDNKVKLADAISSVTEQFSEKQKIFNKESLKQINSVVQNNTALTEQVINLQEREVKNNKLAESLMTNKAENKKMTKAAIAEVAEISKNLDVEKITDQNIDDQILAQEKRITDLTNTIESIQEKKPKRAISLSQARGSSEQLRPQTKSNFTSSSNKPTVVEQKRERTESEIKNHNQAVTSVAGIQNAIIDGAPIVPLENISLYLNKDLTISEEKLKSAPREIVVKTEKGVVVLVKVTRGDMQKYEVKYQAGKLDIAKFLMVEKISINQTQEQIHSSYADFLKEIAGVE